MKLASLLLLFPVAACSSGARPPGPTPLESADQMTGFLSGARFQRVGDPGQYWSFDADGTFEAVVAGERSSGEWSAGMDRLRLTALADGGPDRELPLRWLDGKLNIEIDGLQYRSTRHFLER